MKKLLMKLPVEIRIIWSLTWLAAWIYCLLVWTGETICTLVIVGQIYHEASKNRERTLAFVVLALISCGAGFVSFFFTRWLGVNEFVQLIMAFAGAIYAMAVCTCEEHQRPYVWLWEKL